MATLVLTVAGAAIGAATFGTGIVAFGLTAAQIGMAVGGVIGSMIDQWIFAPDAPNVQGPRLTDLKVQSAAYGQPINRCWGRVRVAGNIIDSTDLRETAHSQDAGKGGGGGGSTSYTYDVDAAIGVCVGPITRFERVWADTKVIRGEVPKVLYAFTGTDISFAATDNSINSVSTDFEGLIIGDQITVSGSASNNGTFTVSAVSAADFSYVGATTATFNPDTGKITVEDSTNFGTLTAGKKITISRSPANSGVFTVVGGGVGYVVVSEPLVSEAVGAGITITSGPSKLVVTGGTLVNESAGATVTITEIDTGLPDYQTVNVASFTSYLGSETQNADPLLESLHGGVGTVPAYRGIAYTVFEKLQLADYANRIPNFTFEAVAGENITVGNIVTDIMLAAGYTALEFDATELNMAIKGYVVAEQMSAREAVSPLMGIYQFDAYEFNGVVYFRKRKTATAGEVTIPETDLGVFDGDSNPDELPAPLEITRTMQDELPLELSLTFIDIDRDYQTNTVRSRRITPFSKGEQSLSVNLVLDADEAQQAVEIMHYKYWNDQTSYRFSTDWSKILVNPGANILVQYDSRNHFMRIERKVVRIPGIIDFEGKYEDVTTFTNDTTNPGAPLPAAVVRLPGFAVFLGMDQPILRAVDDDAGFYWCVSWRDGTDGARLYRSLDDGNTYDEIGSISDEANLGHATTVLANHSLWPARDNVNKVRVLMNTGTPTSILESTFVASDYDNLIRLGSEMIQFKTATLISTGIYELSGLKRGLFGTEWAMGSHAVGERCFIMSIVWMRRVSDSASYLNVSAKYKIVPVGMDILDVPAVVFTNTGVGKKPYAPWSLQGTRHSPATNDWSLSWERRSRIPYNILEPAPLGEDEEEYDVEIMNGSNVVRTVTVTVPSFIYTAAMQTTDFGSVQTTVTFKVYQRSTTVGRGYVAQAAV